MLGGLWAWRFCCLQAFSVWVWHQKLDPKLCSVKQSGNKANRWQLPQSSQKAALG